MMAAHVLVALVLLTAGTTLVPSAAALPCLVGDPSCAVSVQTYVCVTEPCDTARVCVGFGLFCKTV